jgi:MFS family permease
MAVARFFANLAIAPSVTVAVGVINDVWDVKTDKLGSITVVLYAAMQVWATEVGPCAGAAIVQDTGNYRWTFWLTTILLGVSTLTLLNPETYAPEISRRREINAGREVPTRGNVVTLLRVAGGRAVHMLVVEPIVWPTAIMNGLYGAIIYCFYITYPLIFERVYSFTTYQVGLAFLSPLVGSMLGLVIIAIIDKRVYQKAVTEAQQLGMPVKPEGRLYAALIGSLLMPIGLFWYVPLNIFYTSFTFNN